jgi:hypothetical protein
MRGSRIALVFGLLAAALPLQRADASDWQQQYGEDLCGTNWVLSAIKMQNSDSFRKYHETNLVLVDIINPRLTYERQRDAEHNVDRKFCHAKVRMANGSRHEIRDMWYLIEMPWGFAGTPGSSNMEFCIAGLDPWHVYGKECSTIRNAIGF